MSRTCSIRIGRGLRLAPSRPFDRRRCPATLIAAPAPTEPTPARSVQCAVLWSMADRTDATTWPWKACGARWPAAGRSGPSTLSAPLRVGALRAPKAPAPTTQASTSPHMVAVCPGEERRRDTPNQKETKEHKNERIAKQQPTSAAIVMHPFLLFFLPACLPSFLPSCLPACLPAFLPAHALLARLGGVGACLVGLGACLGSLGARAGDWWVVGRWWLGCCCGG
jgi:hypothetical protein